MATVTITLTDVEVKDVPNVNMKLAWDQDMNNDVKPTKAMLAADQIRHLFASNKIDIDEALRRLQGQADLVLAARKAAKGEG